MKGYLIYKVFEGELIVAGMFKDEEVALEEQRKLEAHEGRLDFDIAEVPIDTVATGQRVVGSR